jgi:transcriptional regulator with XRE-family HTH domain
MENVKEIIAKNLVSLRKSKKMTQQELAERLNYSDKAVSRWEHAETLPDIETLFKICEIYNVRFEYLLQKEQAPDSKNKYIIQRDFKNKVAITTIAVLSVWLIASLAYIYFNWFIEFNFWQIFIYAIPVSSIVCQICNNLWGTELFGYIIVSLTTWSMILSIYIAFLSYNVWMVFIIGVPIQIIIILAATLKKNK